MSTVEARSVEINDRTVVVERFTLAKAMRVITLLQLIQKQVPEVSKEWAAFRKSYAEDYATDLDRMQAVARFGPQLEHLTEADWERASQKFRIPGAPSQAEVFFQMAPIVYERAEQVTLRLLGLIAMENELVNRYVAKGDVWDRVDELVDEIIRPAGLDEIMELGLAAAEVIDGQVLAKAKGLGDRAGNLARLLGVKTKTSSEESGTLSEQPVQPNTVSVSPSPTDSTGSREMSSGSPGISSSPSPTSSTVSVA